MNQNIEVEDNATGRLEMVLDAANKIMEAAKSILNDGNVPLPPACFVVKIVGNIADVVCLPEMSMENEEEKNKLASIVRKVSRMLDADAVIMATDAFVWTMNKELIEQEYGDIQYFVDNFWTQNTDHAWRSKFANSTDSIIITTDSHWGKAMFKQQYSVNTEKEVIMEGDIEKIICDDRNDTKNQLAGRFMDLLGSKKEKPNG